MEKQYIADVQQGDVIFHQLTSLPKGVKQLKFNQNLIIRYGEKSGHVHEVATEDLHKVELYTLDELMFLVAKEEVKIVHNKNGIPTNEHQPIMLDSGVYQVGDIVEEKYAFGDSKVKYYKPEPVRD